MSNIAATMDLLVPRTRQRALAALLLAPGQAFHLRELARLTHSNAGTLLRDLEKLEKVGLVVRTVQGNQARFEANRAHALFADLSAMFRKTHGVAAILRDALAPLAGKIDLALVFGSMAGASHRAGSDIDLLVVGSASFSELVTALHPAQESTGREISPVLYSAAEFRERAGRGEGFLGNVLGRPMIFIQGDRHDLEKLAGDKPPAGAPD